MTETPPRLRSYAPPTRDKIFIWSAVVAGCGIMALLGCHAAIHRFGTDQFTGNVLFAVFFVLSIGLYCGFKSVIEDVFNRFPSLFRRPEVMAIAETTTGEQIAIPTVEVPEPSMMECSAPAQDFVTNNCPEMTYPNDSNEGNSTYIVSVHIPKVMIQSVALPRLPKKTASSRMTARYA